MIVRQLKVYNNKNNFYSLFITFEINESIYHRYWLSKFRSLICLIVVYDKQRKPK